VTAEDEVKDMSHVNSDVAKELTEESQCTALNSHIGRVGESRARQSGEQNERRTHIELCVVLTSV
jgi:hypothetical protein